MVVRVCLQDSINRKKKFIKEEIYKENPDSSVHNEDLSNKPLKINKLI